MDEAAGGRQADKTQEKNALCEVKIKAQRDQVIGTDVLRSTLVSAVEIEPRTLDSDSRAPSLFSPEQ